MIHKEVFSMSDKTSVIFGNPIDIKTINAAEKSKKKYIKKYGDDTNKDHKLGFEDIPTLDFMGCKNLVFKDKVESLGEKSLIVGNTRMGFCHYRISIAMASCAKALGFTPYW
jgi:hypothetical protein